MATALKRVPHPSGDVITFNPAKHVYSFQGSRCKSVSAVLNGYFPFDAERVAKLVAQKQDKTPQEVLDEWKLSAQLGTNVHSHIEALLLSQPPPVFSVRQGLEDKFIPVATAAVDRVKADYDIIAVETIVVSAKYKIAGTIDFLAKNKRTGAVMVGDWKTTNSASTGFKFSSFEGPCPGLCRHVPNAKLSRYGLQTMLYGHILQEEGYGKLIDPSIGTVPLEYGLVRFGPDQFGEIQADFTRVVLDDFTAVDGDADLPATTLLPRILALAVE